MFKKLCKEVGEWSASLFGEGRTSKINHQKFGSQLAFTGLVSEVGELGNAIIAHHQGRKGYGPTPEGIEKYDLDIRDAVADICIFLADFCYQEGIDVEEITMNTWNNIVKKRTIKNWEEHSHEKPPSSGLESELVQTGHGFAEPVEELRENPPESFEQFFERMDSIIQEEVRLKEEMDSEGASNTPIQCEPASRQFELVVEVWPVGSMQKAISVMKQAEAMLDGASYDRVHKLIEDFEKELAPWLTAKAG